MDILNNKFLWIAVGLIVLLVLFFVFNARYNDLTTSIRDISGRIDDIEQSVYKIAGLNGAIPSLNRTSTNQPTNRQTEATMYPNNRAAAAATSQATSQATMPAPKPSASVINPLSEPAVNPMAQSINIFSSLLNPTAAAATSQTGGSGAQQPPIAQMFSSLLDPNSGLMSMLGTMAKNNGPDIEEVLDEVDMSVNRIMEEEKEEREFKQMMTEIDEFTSFKDNDDKLTNNDVSCEKKSANEL